ncbi:MAG: fused MFS/spermidine synthase [Desulfobacterales bacterium]|nr:MAG: fused MFS/spermidine synthase [Desulfobacterales bacterium]
MAKNGFLDNPSPKIYFLVLTCFFLSGFSGLIYEILWTRMITQIIGSAPFSVSIILTIFMGGLGVGSCLGGRVIDRVRAPLVLVKLYGLLELVIGAYALLIPLLLIVLKPLQTVIYNWLYRYFIVYNLLTFLICAVILCIPVICMGATLPILCRFYVARLDNLGTHAGRLYGLNTIGAALGSLVCGFWLINLWGVWGSLALAVSVNTMIGLSCLAVSYQAQVVDAGDARGASTAKKIAPNVKTNEESPVQALERKAALVIFVVSGFCAMACEVIWTRLLGLIVGPTTYSFTIVLVTFITGLGLGSLIFGYVADRTKDCLRLLLFTQVAAALLVLAVSQLLGNSELFFAKLIFTFRDQFGRLNVLKAACLFLFMILPTLGFGATFPLVGKIYTRSLANVGRSIGVAYMLNTLGALCGPFCAGFLLIPLFGKESALAFAVGLQLATSLGIAGVVLGTKRWRVLQFGGLAAPVLAGLILCLNYPAWSHRQLSIGKYHQFEEIRSELTASGWFESLFQGVEVLERSAKGELVYYGEGIGGFTTVVKFTDAMGNTNYAMANSGKADASSRNDMETQTLLAHFPMLYHEDPKTVMVIGLASGITAGEVLHYPVEKLDILEINDQVVAASNIFIPWNNGVLSDPRTHLIIQDARAHIQLTGQTYDVIISEPSNPWMAGLAELFTRDFFSLARERLNAEGIFVQWMHAYQMDWETFALVGRTFAGVFPNSRLVIMNPSKHEGDFLLVGIKGDHKPVLGDSPQKLSHLWKSQNVTLKDPRLLYRLVVSEDLPGLFGPGAVHTDDRPRLEFSAPKLMYHADREIFEKIWAQRAPSLSAATSDNIRRIEASVDSQIDYAAYTLSVFNPFSGMVDLAQATPSQKERFFDLMERYCAANEIDYAILSDDELKQRCASIQIEAIEEKIDRLPNRLASLSYLGNLYVLKGRASEAIRYYQEAVQIAPRSASAHNNLGVAFLDQGSVDEAIRHLTESLRLDPQNPKAQCNLGIALAKKGRLDDAVPRFLEALRLNPDYEKAHYRLGLARTVQGQLTEAVRHFSEALRVEPEYLEAHNELGILLAKQGRFDDAARHFSRALQINPAYAEAHNNLGIALASKGNVEDAVAHFKAALRLRPDFTGARDNLEKAMELREN